MLCHDPLMTPRPIPPLQIFLAFLRLGFTAFGGPAMVAYIRELVVTKKGWVSEESFADGVALCQSIPGATAMQSSAYAGFRAGGIAGAAAAYVGFGLPAFCLMVTLSAVYIRTQDFQVTTSLFTGLRVIVVVIIANAAINFGRVSLKSYADALLALFVALFLGFGGHPIIAIILAAALALLVYRRAIPDGEKIPEHHHPAFAGRVALLFSIGSLCAVTLLAVLLFAVDRRLFDLAIVMAKIDLFAFGGGFAAIPLMLRETVDARHWLDGESFMDGIALGQVTPGPIVITATFVGYNVAGLAGAIAATLGIFTPSFILLIAGIAAIDRLRQSALFRRALRGAIVSFVGLLVAVALRFAIAAPWSVLSVTVALAAFLALRLRVDMLWVVLIGAGVSVLFL